jgi:hypothetical protein
MEETQNEFSKYINNKGKSSLWVFTKQKEEAFKGSLTFFEMMRFIKFEITKSPMLFLNSSSQYKRVLKEQKYFFLYTGSKKSAELSRVVSAVEKFTKTLIFYTNNPKIVTPKHVEEGKLYFKVSSSKKIIKMETAMTPDNLKKWVILSLLNKYKMIQSVTYDRMKKKRKSIFVLVLENVSDFVPQMEGFIRFAEAKDKNVVPRICNFEEIHCKRFLHRIGKIQFKKLVLPLLFMVKPSEKSSDDFIFWHSTWVKTKGIEDSQKYKIRYLKKYVSDVIENKMKPSVFTEKDKMGLIPSDIHRLNYTSFKNFRKKIQRKVNLILFHDTRQCYQSCSEKSAIKSLCNPRKKVVNMSLSCKKLVNQYELVVETMIESNQKLKARIDFMHYDLGRNSYDFLGIQKQAPFIRLYKTNGSFVDLKIGNDHLVLFGKLNKFIKSHVKGNIVNRKSYSRMNNSGGEKETEL